MTDPMAPRAPSRAIDLAFELRGFGRKLRRRLRDQADVGDLTPSQTAVLLRLEQDGPATTSALARAEGMRPQSMSAVVAALEAAALVAGAPDPRDGRQTLLSLTNHCRRWMAESRAARQDWLSRTIDTRLTPQEQAQLAAAIPLLQRLAQGRPDDRVARRNTQQTRIDLLGGFLAKMFRCPGLHLRRPAQQKRCRKTHRQRQVPPRRRRHGRDRAVQPAAVHPLVGAAFQIILRLEMAAAAVMPRHSMQDQQLVRRIHVVQRGERGVQPKHPAKIIEPARLAWRGQRQLLPDILAGRIAIGLHGGEPVQRAAHENDNQAPISERMRGRIGKSDRRAAKREGGTKAEQRLPAVDARRQGRRMCRI